MILEIEVEDWTNQTPIVERTIVSTIERIVENLSKLWEGAYSKVNSTMI